MSLNLLNSNLEALELLDWFQITEDIASLSHFEKTKSFIKGPPQARTPDLLQRDLDRLEIFIKNYDDYIVEFNSKIRRLPDSVAFFMLIPDLHKGKFFTTYELNFFAQLLETFNDCFSFFKAIFFEKDYGLSLEASAKLKKEFITPLREFVDFSGNASCEKHPLLKKLYAEVLGLEHDLRVTVQKASKSELYASRLQMDTYDIINDRYVLAVRSDSYQSELGPIIARSQSGMTLFVEPFEVREKSNRRIFLLSEIESTILKLTIELSKVTHRFAQEISLTACWFEEIDWLYTKATYTVKLGLSKPVISDKFSFEFHGLFHPLISNPVPNNLELEINHRGLIISGPNTGGKTVALKSICLSVLFLHLGLFLPATSARVYPVEDLFYFSHDHQNLTEGLSSFASESKHYLQLLQNLKSRNLIIIDEIFNSTSSEEASALAISFIDEIHQRSISKIIISTHHQVLKTFMHSREDYVSAHVGYDFDTNRPTFKLIFGEPGSSLAFKIFENLSAKFGLLNQISNNAKNLLDHKQVTYESLLQELSQKKIDLDKQLSFNRLLTIELKNQKASMEGILFLERERVLNDYTKKIRALFDQAEVILEQVKKGEISNKKILARQTGQLQSSLNQESKSKQLSNDIEDKYSHLQFISFEDISLNMTVFSIVAKKNVKVVQINARKKEIQIQHGALSVWVAPSTLRWPSGIRAAEKSVRINVDRVVKGDIEIDCRGMRLNEFQKTCEQAIDEVYSGEIPFVTIIHGHGDGVLKNWLRSFLKQEYRDLRWENIEGNDGCTKIFFN